jgi:hypothetical protein
MFLHTHERFFQIDDKSYGLYNSKTKDVRVETNLSAARISVLQTLLSQQKNENKDQTELMEIVLKLSKCHLESTKSTK